MVCWGGEGKGVQQKVSMCALNQIKLGNIEKEEITKC